MISQLGLAGIWVSDQDAAIDFYVNVLGFELLTDTRFGENDRWVEVVPAGAETGLTISTPHPTSGHGAGKDPAELIGSAMYVWFSRDIAETHRHLASKGVVFSEEPTLQPWGMLQAQFKDPDGNHFVLVERTGIRS